ncbi:hypothetical protein HYPSUDRAFT_954908 [Hypholoma sublateritium FD-334 SS-4]|uniref:Uncharacterized protein n=1 Tax=Hypholoma sublateritium (strain FD-334 SS-4) TaxID=945553 RepID=A0A0D2NNY2_HYPSF|nr:hypothetical protein HYPSUDRAFT_954908 [Hypholoma sublateritium FD-334 SS-4]
MDPWSYRGCGSTRRLNQAPHLLPVAFLAISACANAHRTERCTLPVFALPTFPLPACSAAITCVSTVHCVRRGCTCGGVQGAVRLGPSVKRPIAQGQRYLNYLNPFQCVWKTTARCSGYVPGHRL